ncbi:MAG: flagellar filament capping protein FliD [Myxococcota bacterium]
MGLRVGGLATGLDTNALVDALLALERRPLELIQQRRTEIELQQSLFRDLNTRLLTLRDAAAALDNRTTGLTGSSFDEEFLAYAATSSDETLVEATTTGNANPGSFDIHVDQLAAVGRRISVGFASSTDVVFAEGETLQIDHGGAAPIALTVAAGGTSLEGLRDAINTDVNNQGDVRADVVFDGTDYRLVVSGTRTGAENDVTVSGTVSGPGGGALLDDTLTQVAQDASFQVLGLTVTRPSNEISDALPGISLRLRGVHANPTDVTFVDVARDDEAITEGLQTFVDAYNSVIEFLDGQSSFDETLETAGPLSGDFTLRAIEQTVQRTLVDQYAFAGNPFNSLVELGVSFDDEGRLSLDSGILTTALDLDPFAARQMLSGDGTSDGLMTAIARALDPITESATGSIAVRQDGFEERIDGIDRQIERFELRLEQREELLILQFSRLESSVAALQAQSNSLAGLVTPTQS